MISDPSKCSIEHYTLVSYIASFVSFIYLYGLSDGNDEVTGRICRNCLKEEDNEEYMRRERDEKKNYVPSDILSETKCVVRRTDGRAPVPKHRERYGLIDILIHVY